MEEIINAAELKLISAKKFRLAVAELRGEVTSAEASPKAQVQGQAQAQVPVSDSASSAGYPSQQPPEAKHQKTSEEAVQECVAICIDRSGSMGSPFNEVTLNVVKGETKNSIAQRTRMEA